MKVTLISLSPEEKHISGVGIRILSSCLKKEDFDVRVIFLPRRTGEMYSEETLKEIIELCRESGLIGISLMTDDLENVVRINRALKASLNIPVVWGGVHPTISPEECLNYVDMVCIGEGEDTLVELVRKMRSGQDFRRIRGLWVKDDGRVIKNELRPLIQDLDAIPFQDYAYETHFVLIDGHIQQMTQALFQDMVKIPLNYLVLTSRGCVYECTYCWNHTIKKMFPGQPFLRKRSIDNIIQELTFMRRAAPSIDYIYIVDDDFFIRTEKELADFSEKYKERVGLPFWVTGVHPLTLTKKKLSILVNAGLADVRMGIQTMSESTKKMYKRGHSQQEVEKAAKIIHEFKDKIKLPKYDIILDNPFESEDDNVVTLLFLTKLPTPYYLFFFPLMFYPATDLYERAKRENLIPGDAKAMNRIRRHEFNNVYVNKLFFLLNDYTSAGHRISPKTMSWLTDKKLRRFKISGLLCEILKIRALSFRIKYLLGESLKDIRKGDWSRVRKVLSRAVKKKSLRSLFYLLMPYRRRIARQSTLDKN